MKKTLSTFLLALLPACGGGESRQGIQSSSPDGGAPDATADIGQDAGGEGDANTSAGDPDAGPSPCDETQVLVDGNVDTVPTSWTLIAGTTVGGPGVTGGPAHSAPNIMWLDDGDAQHGFTVPAGTDKLNVRGQMQSCTAACGDADDGSLVVRMTGPGGQSWTHTLVALGSAQGWTPFELPSEEGVAPTSGAWTIRLEGTSTNMFVDSMTVTAEDCQ